MLFDGCRAAIRNTDTMFGITNAGSHLVGTLVGHDSSILSLIFSSPSSLICLIMVQLDSGKLVSC